MYSSKVVADMVTAATNSLIGAPQTLQHRHQQQQQHQHQQLQQHHQQHRHQQQQQQGQEEGNIPDMVRQGSVGSRSSGRQGGDGAGANAGDWAGEQGKNDPVSPPSGFTDASSEESANASLSAAASEALGELAPLSANDGNRVEAFSMEEGAGGRSQRSLARTPLRLSRQSTPLRSHTSLRDSHSSTPNGNLNGNTPKRGNATGNGSTPTGAAGSTSLWQPSPGAGGASSRYDEDREPVRGWSGSPHPTTSVDVGEPAQPNLAWASVTSLPEAQPQQSQLQQQQYLQHRRSLESVGLESVGTDIWDESVEEKTDLKESQGQGLGTQSGERDAVRGADTTRSLSDAFNEAKQARTQAQQAQQAPAHQSPAHVSAQQHGPAAAQSQSGQATQGSVSLRSYEQNPPSLPTRPSSTPKKGQSAQPAQTSQQQREHETQLQRALLARPTSFLLSSPAQHHPSALPPPSSLGLGFMPSPSPGAAAAAPSSSSSPAAAVAAQSATKTTATAGSLPRTPAQPHTKAHTPGHSQSHIQSQGIALGVGMVTPSQNSNTRSEPLSASQSGSLRRHKALPPLGVTPDPALSTPQLAARASGLVTVTPSPGTAGGASGSTGKGGIFAPAGMVLPPSAPALCLDIPEDEGAGEDQSGEPVQSEEPMWSIPGVEECTSGVAGSEGEEVQSVSKMWNSAVKAGKEVGDYRQSAEEAGGKMMHGADATPRLYQSETREPQQKQSAPSWRDLLDSRTPTPNSGKGAGRGQSSRDYSGDRGHGHSYGQAQAQDQGQGKAHDVAYIAAAEVQPQGLMHVVSPEMGFDDHDPDHDQASAAHPYHHPYHHRLDHDVDEEDDRDHDTSYTDSWPQESSYSEHWGLNPDASFNEAEGHKPPLPDQQIHHKSFAQDKHQEAGGVLGAHEGPAVIEADDFDDYPRG